MHTESLRTLTGKLNVTIPENLSELTIGQLIAIRSDDNLSDLKAISVLSGVDIDLLNNVSSAELDRLRDRILSLAHQIKYCYEGQKLPEYVKFGTHRVKRFGFWLERENRIKVATNLSVEPAGAFLASKDLIAEEINRHIGLYGEDHWRDNFDPDIDTMASVLGHYFYCRVTKLPYNEQQAEQFKEQILKLPVQVALPIGRHFFLNYPDLLQQKHSLWQVFRQSLKRKLVSHRLKSSRSTIQ